MIFSQPQKNDHALQLDSISNRKIYVNVDRMPEFPGGKEAMFNFIYMNITYPKGICVGGSVLVSFVVEPTGQLTNKKIIKGITKQVDKEALKVIDKMPNWIPGVHQGQNVAVEVTVPINFTLTE